MGHHQRRADTLSVARRRHLARRDRGSVTAEFAVLMPAILIVIVMVVVVGLVGAAHVRNHDAARQAVRLSAVGEPAADVRRTAATIAGADASVTLTREGEWVSVTVSRQPALPGGWTLPFRLSATAYARAEDGHAAR